LEAVGLSFTHSGDARIYWEASGAGEPLLLIQGLGLSAALWYRVVPLLDQRHRVIRYDARGTGRSDVPEGPYPIESMAADALAVLDAAGESSAHVFGMSLGGLVAQELAISHSDRVRSLMLCSTLAGGTDVVPIDPDVIEMLRANATLPPAESVRASIPVAYAKATDRNWIEEDIALRLELPTTATGYQNQLMGSAIYPGTKSRLPQVTLPALVIAGAEDKIAPPANADILVAALPTAKLLLIPDAGHMVITDQADVLAAAMTGFIADIQVSASRPA
jgi:pimeloyl-ACP methyl ester carboxylesterase